MVDATYVKHSKPIDLSSWSFSVHLSDEQIGKMVAEAIQNSLDREAIDVSFPSMWKNGDGIGGPSPSHPDEIHISLTLLGGTDCGPTFSVRLKSLVEDFIELKTSEGEHPIPLEDVENVRRFRAAIKESLEIIDVELEKIKRGY